MSLSGVVFEIREFCLHDGPGVRTTVFMKGCPLRCTWCHNPEGLSPEPEMVYKKARCKHCGYCSHGGKLCPERAREMCGMRMTVEELVANLASYGDFFRKYGGGVTFSGGEPLLQGAFVAAVAAHLHTDESAHPAFNLAIETSGYAPAETYREVVQHLDLVFQDLKHPDPLLHKRWTGVDPAPIHANLKWLKASGKPFIARIPLIPGVNDTPEAKEGFAKLLEGPSGLIRVELLPYHLTAAAKYPFVGKDYKPGFDESVPLNKDLAPFTARGLDAVVM